MYSKVAPNGAFQHYAGAISFGFVMLFSILWCTYCWNAASNLTNRPSIFGLSDDLSVPMPQKGNTSPNAELSMFQYSAVGPADMVK